MVFCIRECGEYYEGLSEINNHQQWQANKHWSSAVHLHSANYSFIVLINRPTKKTLTSKIAYHMIWKYWILARRLHGEYFESTIRDMYKSSKCTPQSIFFRLSIANIFVNRNFSTNVRRILSATPCTMWHIAHLSFPFSQTQSMFATAASTLNNIKIKYLQAVSSEKQLKQCQVYLRRCAIMQYRDSHIEMLNKKIYCRF